MLVNDLSELRQKLTELILPNGRQIEPATLAELEEAARIASTRAYAPYSKFQVGAAILTGSGKITQGCNVENASYGLTICAERNAIFSAALSGEREVHAVVVYTPTDVPTPPCGACRQVINEFGPDSIVVSLGNAVKRLVARLNELLPGAFGPRNLAR